MRTSLRRAVALFGLTATVVVSGSIAAADGPDAGDIAEQALQTTPVDVALERAEATDLTDETVADDAATRRRARTASVVRAGDRTAAEPGYIAVASWYGPGFHGRTTANGETYDQYAMTAAHKTLPFGTRLRVTNVANGRNVVVRINDRGPFIPGREIDLSRAAADALGFIGLANVRIEHL